MSLFVKEKNTYGAMLLVTGCCIGAGMIGLPVMSAFTGFLPSSIIMLLCYLFTTLTGLLLLEATLWFENHVNLPSIVEQTLGKIGKSITFILFLFLFYCIFVAYLDGGGFLFADMLKAFIHHPVSREVGVLICALFVAIITYAGAKIIDGINRVLLIGLIMTYFILVLIGFPHISKENLAYLNWNSALATIPILLICFGYQNLVPSLTYYLKKNVNAIRFAIIIGNLIPFFVYFLWNFVILGMLSPADSMSAKESSMVTQLLQNVAPSLSIIIFIKAFSLFAMLTSFIPSAISFIDFLRDGFKTSLPKVHKNDFFLLACVFIPPLICALVNPNIFLQALEFAGGFIDVLLFGMLPALVILVGRNVKKMSGSYQVVGGNLTPMLVLILSLSILFLKVYAYFI